MDPDRYGKKAKLVSIIKFSFTSLRLTLQLRHGVSWRIHIVTGSATDKMRSTTALMSGYFKNDFECILLYMTRPKLQQNYQI